MSFFREHTQSNQMSATIGPALFALPKYQNHQHETRHWNLKYRKLNYHNDITNSLFNNTLRAFKRTAIIQ